LEVQYFTQMDAAVASLRVAVLLPLVSKIRPVVRGPVVYDATRGDGWVRYAAGGAAVAYNVVRGGGGRDDSAADPRGKSVAERRGK
jgi:hypothetical protein